ncbi:hypothetical protein HanPSC8_Chr08g0310551 [Helianthus annuus]|nr:hypothetical protein HanPSC8_Chr08g0310551 [Helianthus annuus]
MAHKRHCTSLRPHDYQSCSISNKAGWLRRQVQSLRIAYRVHLVVHEETNYQMALLLLGVTVENTILLESPRLHRYCW